MTISSEEIVEKLVGFGLTDIEARVYFHLIMLQKAKAAEVAHATGKRRPDVYPILDRLCEQGLVHRSVDRPTIYVPLPMSTALQRIVQRERLRLDSRAAEAAHLAELMPQVQSTASMPADRMAIHQGVAQIAAIMEERIAAAEQEVLCILSPGLMSRLEPVVDLLQRRARAGCTVRVLSTINVVRDAEQLAQRLWSCHVRHDALPSHLEMVLIDGKESFQFISAGRADSTHGAEEIALWLQSNDIVLAHEGIFDRLWGSGVDLENRLAELATGRSSERVNVMRGRWVRNTRLRQMITSAHTSVVCIVGARELARWERTDTVAWLKAKKDAQVQVTIVTDGDAPDGFEAEVTSTPPQATVFIIDGDQALCVVGGKDSDEPTESDEWSIWTTQPDLVRLLRSSIEAPDVVAA